MYNLRKIFMILLYCVVYFSSHFYDFILMCSVIFIAHLSARICPRAFVGAYLSARICGRAFVSRDFVGAHLSVAILSGHGFAAGQST
jgi:hypothetical protein